MTKSEFLKALKALSVDHRDRFGFPFLPVGLVHEATKLSSSEFQKLLTKCYTGGDITMTPLDEKILNQLPHGLEVVLVEGKSFVSLSLVS
ncbi:hypothetical protein [Anthocerotibacter panamensis]|uniref:hypothetical protein n=1 Tax=Anthocerotibacter panamensis TaxID=2857077 RepID=UPI001C402A17|nr:hypothetical protein [Anthocerotibacter panamensis]